MAYVRKKQGETITKDDVAYVSFALDEHVALLDKKKSCPWDKTVDMHKKHAKEIKAALAKMQKTGKVKDYLVEDDILFICFSMDERCDFLAEGIGKPWHADVAHDALKGKRFLEKLKKLFGFEGKTSWNIPEPEVEPN